MSSSHLDPASSEGEFPTSGVIIYGAVSLNAVFSCLYFYVGTQNRLRCYLAHVYENNEISSTEWFRWLGFHSLVSKMYLKSYTQLSVRLASGSVLHCCTFIMLKRKMNLVPQDLMSLKTNLTSRFSTKVTDFPKKLCKTSASKLHYEIFVLQTQGGEPCDPATRKAAYEYRCYYYNHNIVLLDQKQRAQYLQIS